MDQDEKRMGTRAEKMEVSCHFCLGLLAVGSAARVGEIWGISTDQNRGGIEEQITTKSNVSIH